MERTKFASAVVIKDDQILLMHRLNNGKEYYTLPGGGREEGETAEENALRELKEETSIDASINRLLYKVNWDTGKENYYFLCDYISGKPYLPESSEEFEEMKNGVQVYEPMWLPISDLLNTLVYPLEIRDLIAKDIENGFSEKTLELSMIFGARKL
jgi:8-oxo-dGTP diphosphatase